MTNNTLSQQELAIYISNEGWKKYNQYLAVEKFLTIKVNGEHYLSLSRTPGEENKLVIGRLYVESLIADVNDIKELNFIEHDQADIIEVSIKNSFSRDCLKSYAVGSDGSLGSMEGKLIPLAKQELLDPKIYLQAAFNLKNHQPLFQACHSTHSIGLYDDTGNIISAHEDIGRHNAMDKAIGHILLNKLKPAFMVLSGRGGAEMILKAIRASCPTLICISLPSLRAMKLANKYNLNLAQAWGENKLVVLNSY